MAHRIRIHQIGGPEVLQYEEFDVGEPGLGQVRLLQEAAGVNFVDTQFRDGIYAATLPLTLGVEGAGTVEAVGAGVTDFHIGDRVGYWLSFGSYADARLIDADRLVKLPAGLSSEQAAATFTKGLSAWALVKRAHVLRPGETVLVHASDTADFVNTRFVLEEASNDLWSAFDAGVLKPPPVAHYPLFDARRSHADIRARSVVGSMVLTM